MCGIAGVVGEGGPEDEDAVRAMSDALAHRGPDSHGLWKSGKCVLGHRRLSIIDLSPRANQPILSEDGQVAAVVNGEIYNAPELRAELIARGHRFRSETDSEVAVHLYEDSGPRFVTRLSGMFALGIWDARQSRLVLARDRAGKKPLFWMRSRGGGLAFASELPALLAGFPGHPRRPDLAAVDEYLTLQYVPAPFTAFEGVSKLLAAELLVMEHDRSVRTERYWAPPRGPELRGDDEELARELFRLLEAAVKKRLVADVPLGAFLSGGVDSSTIVGLMARLSSRPVQTFSIGFPDSRDSELPFAREAARRFGTLHRDEIATPDIEEVVLTSVRHHGEPFGDSSAVATYCLARLARRHVKVALSGDGSDEAFAGYARYATARLGHLHDALPRALRPAYGAALRAVSRTVAPHVAGYFEHIGDGEAVRYPYIMCQFTPEERAALFLAPMRAAATRRTTERFERILAASARVSAMGRLIDLDAATYLPDDINAKVDIASMAHALEVRCPFLDTDVVEFASRLPGRLLVRLRGKYLLRRATKGLLPRSILYRQKRGFGLPLRRWLRGPLSGMVRDVLQGEQARGRGLFNTAEVDRLVGRMGADSTAADRVWTLLMLELWFRELVDRPAASFRESRSRYASASCG